MHYSYFDRMTPPEDVRVRLAQNTAKVAKTLNYLMERIYDLNFAFMQTAQASTNPETRRAFPIINMDELDEDEDA